MPSKKHHHIWTQEYETQNGQPRQLYYVRFQDWKQAPPHFPCGDNLRLALKERDRRFGQNAQRFDFDREQQEHERKHLAFAK